MGVPIARALSASLGSTAALDRPSMAKRKRRTLDRNEVIVIADIVITKIVMSTAL